MTERDRSELAELRTRVANAAATLAETVRDGFDDYHLGAGDYVVDLSVPDGPSTGGGRQARQHLRLVPRRKGYATVVTGVVDPVLSTCELRTFEHVAVLHEIRFQRPLEITGDEYADFIAKCDVVMNLARIKVTKVGPTPDLLARKRAASSKRISLPALLFFVVVMLLAAAVVYKVALVMRH